MHLENNISKISDLRQKCDESEQTLFSLFNSCKIIEQVFNPIIFLEI